MNVLTLKECDGMKWVDVAEKMLTLPLLNEWVAQEREKHIVGIAIIYLNLQYIHKQWKFIDTYPYLIDTNYALLKEILQNQEGINVDETLPKLKAYQHIYPIEDDKHRKKICYDFRIFCRKISIQERSPIQWLPNGNIKPCTRLDIYDIKSLLKRIISKNTNGILLEEIYAEYDDAHGDLLALQKTGEIWITPDFQAVFAGEHLQPAIPGLIDQWIPTSIITGVKSEKGANVVVV